MGVSELAVDFNESTTKIHGRNGSGKSTIANGFSWLLYGKTADGRDTQSMAIRPNDANGNPIHHLESSVCAEITIVDGELAKDCTIKRIYKEVWQRPLGSEEQVYKGNTEVFYIDNLRVTATEYAGFISEEIASSKVYIACSSFRYFFELDKKQQRAYLIDLAGEITDEDLIAQNPEFAKLLNEIDGAAIENYKTTLRAKNQELNKTISDIPGRIEENRNNLKEIESGHDEEWCNTELDRLSREIEEIETAIGASRGESNALLEQRMAIVKKMSSIEEAKQRLKNRLTSEAAKAHFEAINTRERLKSEAERLLNKIIVLEDEIKEEENKIETKKARIAILQGKFDARAAETFHFDKELGICPTCHRPLEAEKVTAMANSMRAEWLKKQNEDLDKTEAEANMCNGEITDCNNRIAAKKEEIEGIKEERELTLAKANNTPIPDIETVDLENNIEYINLEKQLAETKEELERIGSDSNNNALDQLTAKKKEIEAEKDKVLLIKGGITSNQKTQERINELYSQQSRAASEVAANERRISLCESYIFAKMSLVENRVNEKFSWVKFRLFKETISGGYQETCEVLIDGAPYADACTSKKTNAGLDIITTFRKHYGFEAPIWIDNAEGINTIRKVPGAQMITLSVSKADCITIE